MPRVSCILSLLLLLILGWGVPANASTIVTPLRYSRTDTIHDIPVSLTLNMPFMRSVDHPAAAGRMNEVIYAQLVRIWPEMTVSATKKILDRADVYGQTSIDHFRVLRNDDRVLSLNVHGSFCGANCTDIDYRYSFDARTGRVIGLGQLLDDDGQAIIRQRVRAHDLQRVHDALAFLNPHDESLADKRTNYLSCLRELHKSDALPDLLVEQNGLSFERNTLCEFPHVIAAWDLTGSDLFTFSQLDSYFTPYGRSVLLGEKPIVAQPAPRIPQESAVFLGTIGTVPIIILLDKRSIGEPEITGSYAYRNYGMMIDISGKFTGTHLHLVEEHGIIDADLEQGTLRGTWHNGLRSLPFCAELQ